MTNEEIIRNLKCTLVMCKDILDYLEQEPCDKCEVANPCLYCKHEFEPQESEDTVPFDFELYQAGLMDMPKGIIEVLNKIRAEIEEIETYDGLYIDRAYVLKIVDKYKAESEDKE